MSYTAESVRTPDAIVERLLSQDLTPIRVAKARGLAQRSHVEWGAVLALLTPEQRAQVESL